ncbi:MAG TPA: NADH-quinone oxidoreductase subunit L [Candidatus Ratteibacteria bacterium]|jgi:NADH:ubiquinone oxidoreductase subunit 5 (subunit L)/multisubunit Na+/H+ antiporter MnhA subunit|nr:NADH-quinone oxidoreductase subunit L [bacterium]HRS06945.1 NADH-quinone oxidoreductase subunit L [Candidatus Ratteibacteria bacterium]HRV04489.1 NADH-quinone oxidoreductase subunit L [Candidatus Ratteibacteria bacterium]
MDTPFFALWTIFVPVLGSITIPIVSLVSNRLRNAWVLLLATITFVLPLFLIPAVFGSPDGQIILRYHLIGSFDFILLIDALSIFVSLVSSFIGALIVLYSFDYIAHEEFQTEYYTMVIFFIGSMMGLVYSGNLIFMYLFWEIAAICSWRLIGFYRLPSHVVKADKAFLITFFGAVVMLFGFIQVYGTTNTFDLTAMRSVPISSLAVFFILIGMFSKSATFPLHTWLPDAGIAPSTVTSLLHAAVLVKIGVYAYARLFCYTFNVPLEWNLIIPVLVMFSSLVSAGAALVENDIKRILALSTVSQIGYIFLGFWTRTIIGVAGGVLFILMHGLAKAGLFLCAGIIEHGTGKRDIRQLGGLFKGMPFTTISFFACILSVIGIPPFGGFFSKFMVLAGTVEAGRPGIAFMGLLIAVMTAMYLFRLFHAVFLGDKRTEGSEGTSLMVGVVFTLAILSLLAGIFISFSGNFVEGAAAHLLEGLK